MGLIAKPNRGNFEHQSYSMKTMKLSRLHRSFLELMEIFDEERKCDFVFRKVSVPVVGVQLRKSPPAGNLPCIDRVPNGPSGCFFQYCSNLSSRRITLLRIR